MTNMTFVITFLRVYFFCQYYLISQLFSVKLKSKFFFFWKTYFFEFCHT